MNVAVYFRCSTDKQDKSIGDQRHVLEEYANKHDLSITAWFDKDEGKTGTNFEKRSDFMRMVSLVERRQNDFKQILVYDVDRWGRPIDPNESTYWEFHFKRFGVSVTYISDESINDNSLAGRLTKKIKQELATEESHKQSLRVRERSKMRAAEGFRVGGFAPYGYKRMLINNDGVAFRVLENGERKFEKSQRVILIPGDPTEILVIQEMFKRKSSGQSLREILEWLNSEHVPAPAATGRMNNGTNRPGKWCINTVYKILTNEAYIGTSVYNRQASGSWVKIEEPGVKYRDVAQHIKKLNAHKPLIAKTIFEKSNWSLRQTKRIVRGRFWLEGPYLLTGLINCARCGYNYHGHAHKTGGQPYYYYEDSGYNLHGKAVCVQSMIPKEPIESFVISQILKEVIPLIDHKRLKSLIKMRLESSNRLDDRSESIRARMGEIDRKLNNIKNSIENGIDPTFIRDRIVSLTRTKSELESELSKIEVPQKSAIDPGTTADQIISLVDRFQEIVSSSAPSKVKQLLKHFVKKIEIDGVLKTASCYLYKIPKPDCSNICFVGKIMPEVGIIP